MKRVCFLILSLCLLFLIGCKEDEIDPVINSKIFEDISYTETEIIVTKYVTSIDEYICKYKLDSMKIESLVSFIESFEGREKTLRSDDELNKYYFKIGEYEFLISNIICEYNENIYRIDYNVDAYFDNLAPMNEEDYLTIGEIIDLEDVNKIVLYKYMGIIAEDLYFTTNKKIKIFLSYLDSVVLNECDLAKGIQVYNILVDDVTIEIYKKNNEFYFRVNEKIYYTIEPLMFLNEYNKDNTDENVTNQLPWV